MEVIESTIVDTIVFRLIDLEGFFSLSPLAKSWTNGVARKVVSFL
jgi:hypothetical protein